MPMEKYWPRSRAPGVLLSAVSSSKAEDGAQVSRPGVRGALFRTLDGSLNAHGPDPPFSTLSTTRPLPSPPSSNRSVSAEPGGSWAYGRLGTSEASGCVCGGPLQCLEQRLFLRNVTGDGASLTLVCIGQECHMSHLTPSCPDSG